MSGFIEQCQSDFSGFLAMTTNEDIQPLQSPIYRMKQSECQGLIKKYHSVTLNLFQGLFFEKTLDAEINSARQFLDSFTYHWKNHFVVSLLTMTTNEDLLSLRVPIFNRGEAICSLKTTFKKCCERLLRRFTPRNDN